MRITFNSPVILIFSFLCAGVYLLTPLFDQGNSLFVLYPVWDFDNIYWYFRLFSNAVGHANTEHLMSNLAFILLLGPLVEEKYGSKHTLVMLLTTSLACSFIHLLFSNAGLLGASGIVFMLILLTSLVNFRSGEIPLTFILIVIVYIGKEVIGTFSDDNVSHTTHIVGGIVGAFFGFLLNKNGKSKSTRKNPLNVIK